jgi:polysaccharide pyruvyl transferase WcaK-like protein
MRIIVATGLNAGTAEYKNLGDVAMLQVAVARLSTLWPDARIEVLTDSPADLAAFCPGADALPRSGSECWVGDRLLLGQYHRFLPTAVSFRLSELKRLLRRYCPTLLGAMIHLRFGLRDSGGRRVQFCLFQESFKRANLLVICGSGGFADSCREWNLSTLALIDAAIQRHIPVVMFGQGMGPLSDSLVLSRAREILPAVDLITLRGSQGGLSLLESIGVTPARVTTTGDEAIELAYAQRTRIPGYAVGVNLRVATYSQISSITTPEVAAVLQAFARRHRTTLLPIPIAFHQSAQDHEVIRQILSGFDDSSDGGESLTTPEMVVRQAGRCRIVVTGAYHAAVFALAQGIPAVCLSNSAYYFAKFQGLEELFGFGCATVMLTEPDWSLKLSEKIEMLWNSADRVRSALLKSAGRQIEDGRSAYRRVKKLIDSCQTEPVLLTSSQVDWR